MNFWSTAWAHIKRVARSVAAFLPVVLLILGAIILIALGAKNLQIGGLLDKLLGKESSKGTKALDAANSVPADRLDKDGNLIQLGTPDSKGTTQVKVVSIEPGGMFDRDDQVKILVPDSTEPILVDLPDGVKSKDVDKVIILTPGNFVVTVKDSSTITPKDVNDLLKKYGN